MNACWRCGKIRQPIVPNARTCAMRICLFRLNQQRRNAFDTPIFLPLLWRSVCSTFTVSVERCDAPPNCRHSGASSRYRFLLLATQSSVDGDKATRPIFEMKLGEHIKHCRDYAMSQAGGSNSQIILSHCECRPRRRFSCRFHLRQRRQNGNLTN